LHAVAAFDHFAVFIKQQNQASRPLNLLDLVNRALLSPQELNSMTGFALNPL